MTMKIVVDRYRLRPPATPAPKAEVSPLMDEDPGILPEPAVTPAAPAPDDGLDPIRREGLTGRQLRLARRMAQMHGLAVTSDHDAVRQLRAAGIDPFDRTAVLDVVAADAVAPAAPTSTALTMRGDGAVRLPQTIKPISVPSTEVRAAQSQAEELIRIQKDMARRRKRKSALLAVRLAVFVGLPTLLMGWYFYLVATPLYEAKSEFVIQTADGTLSAGSAGALGGMLGGAMEAAQDSLAVQGYLQSREAMDRLDGDLGFTGIFQDPAIDPIQRLAPDASEEDAYRTYHRHVTIAYDPTERIVKMTVRAPDPDQAVTISNALIGYAEEQIDALSQRKREDQMVDARATYEDAQAKLVAAQETLVDLQQKNAVLSSEVEVGLITGQIGQLEAQLSTDRLSLAQMESNENPNEARMEPIRRRIATIEAEIATLRGRMTQDGPGGTSLAAIQGELLLAQAEVQTRQLMLSSTLAQLETARIEANRQVRYLSLSVKPTPQDEAAYPRAFENTAVAGLIFAGIYLMIAMTAAILREQVSS
jgi:capsular polysaccharide transport system permease protein